MKTTNRKNWMIGAGMMAALAIFLLPTTNAEAAHRHHHHNRNSVSLSFGGGGCGGYWVPGHYETTTETYLHLFLAAVGANTFAQTAAGYARAVAGEGLSVEAQNDALSALFAGAEALEEQLASPGKMA